MDTENNLVKTKGRRGQGRRWAKVRERRTPAIMSTLKTLLIKINYVSN